MSEGVESTVVEVGKSTSHVLRNYVRDNVHPNVGRSSTTSGWGIMDTYTLAQSISVLHHVSVLLYDSLADPYRRVRVLGS